MAATMAFTSGTAVYAAETDDNSDDDFALEFQGERDQQLLKDWDPDDLITEGDGYSMYKGTPLDDGGYTAWISVWPDEVKGDLNDTISTLLDNKNTVKESYLNIQFREKGYTISRENLEKMKAKDMMFSVDYYEDNEWYGYSAGKVENVYGDFSVSMSYNTDSVTASKVKAAGIDRFYTFTTSGAAGSLLLGENSSLYMQRYMEGRENIVNFEATRSDSYGKKYADNLNMYYYNSSTDRFVAYDKSFYDSETDTESGDAYVNCKIYDDNSGYLYASVRDKCTLNGTYVVTQGEIPSSYLMTGLSHEGNDWLYYKNGKVDTSYTGLYKYNGSWWYVKNGKIDFSATTLCKYNGTWWYVKNGKVDFGSATLCKYNGTWWYVSGGKVNFKATGLCKYNGSWWYVKNGKVDFGATTLCKYNGNWFYVNGGRVSFTTTLCKYNGTWWYINNGIINFSKTTLVKYGSNWYAVAGGKVAWNYTGKVAYNGRNFNVVKGVVKF